jgi:hypothetical protein
MPLRFTCEDIGKRALEQELSDARLRASDTTNFYLRKATHMRIIPQTKGMHPINLSHCSFFMVIVTSDFGKNNAIIPRMVKTQPKSVKKTEASQAQTLYILINVRPTNIFKNAIIQNEAGDVLIEAVIFIRFFVYISIQSPMINNSGPKILDRKMTSDTQTS